MTVEPVLCAFQKHVFNFNDLISTQKFIFPFSHFTLNYQFHFTTLQVPRKNLALQTKMDNQGFSVY